MSYVPPIPSRTTTTRDAIDQLIDYVEYLEHRISALEGRAHNPKSMNCGGTDERRRREMDARFEASIERLNREYLEKQANEEK